MDARVVESGMGVGVESVNGVGGFCRRRAATDLAGLVISGAATLRLGAPPSVVARPQVAARPSGLLSHFGMPLARLVFWAASLGGIVLTIRALVIGPPPLEIALACALVYAAIVVAGVLDLRLQMFADAMLRGPSDARGVVLTFDDVPEHVLDTLDKAKAKATFLVTGAKAPEVVKEIIARGHTVGVRAFADDRWFSLRGPRHVERDLRRAMKALEAITGEKPTLFRPPGGRTNPTIARIADRLELTVVGWSALADGAIVRCNDATKALDAIAAKNLTVVPLGDWLGDAG